MIGVQNEVDMGNRAWVSARLIEDAESAWLRARQRNAEASPPSPALALEHAQLEDMLVNLPSLRVDDSWHDEVLKSAISARRGAIRARWSATVTVVGLAAAASMALVSLSHRAREPELEVEIRHLRDARGAEPMVGDHVIVKARADAESDLRVYRDGSVKLAQCPGGPGCTASGGPGDEKVIDVPLDRPGEYRVILVVGAGLALPSSDSMDDYLAAARKANARLVWRWIDVR